MIIDRLKWYKTVNFSFQNFLGEWKDFGLYKNSAKARLFNNGNKITINADGTWGDGYDREGTAWWNQRNEINLIENGNEDADCFLKLIDGNLHVEQGDKKYILQRRATPTPPVTDGTPVPDNDSNGVDASPTPPPLPPPPREYIFVS